MNSVTKTVIAIVFAWGGMAACLAQSQPGGLATALGSAEARHSMEEAKQVAMACKLFASDHQGRSWCRNICRTRN